jgi:MoaA/NifB/PqqE/SkfB family radical SAM enzyme
MKSIKIRKNVSSRTFYFGKSISRSYVCDEEFHSKFLLKGISSDLWSVILKTQNYEQVKEYAKKRNVPDELDGFLQELEISNLLSLDENKKIDSSSQESLVIDSFYFDENKAKWFQKRGFLQGLTLQLTYNCNLVCKHCFNDKTFTHLQISFDDAKRIIDEAYELGITEVGLTGGECTVDRDFIKIASYIREKRLSLSVLTNGLALHDDEQLFDDFIKIYPSDVKFSLYSLEPELHDKMTGVKGSQQKTLAVIKKLKERNIKIGINFLMTKDNINSMKDVLAFGKENGISVSVTTLFIQNHDNNNAGCRLSIDDIEKLCLDESFPLSIHKRTKTDRPPGMRRENKVICSATASYLSVNSNFDVLPCTDFKFSLGNLKSQNLKEIWTKSVPQFRKDFLKSNLDPECGTHGYCKYCLYCPLQASIENGFMKRSTSSCENAIAYARALNKIKNLKKEKNEATIK